ncbi:ThuA domain-containing protein [Saccharicrinis aurantiacus]|uniref:ThuA domain-containing protein n=1 Tax=Saccharicrinis aurantiacus TaxID=1849719 RepID=UPI00248F4F27|nr:ThuA domain-containing protein [Saccharicrinis aurantiacus]
MKYLVLILIIAMSTFINAQDQFKLLLYTQPDRWHSESIPAAVEAFKLLSKKHQFQLLWADEPAKLMDYLGEVSVVVFVNSNTDLLNTEQIHQFREFINKGVGFVGIHSTSDSKVKNKWFTQLIGGSFTDHPRFQSAIVDVHNDKFPAVLHLTKRFVWSDEWYNFNEFHPDKVNVVLTVDEDSYNYTLGYDDIPLKGMGKSHPVAWYHQFDGARVFYTALGHKPESYKNDDFMKMIFGGIYWVLQP